MFVIGITFPVLVAVSEYVMPITNIAEIMAYKHVKFHTIENSLSNGKNAYTIIKGTYKPGQAKRNITNDGDVKTWTATGTTLPNLKEILTLNFVKHPLCHKADAVGCNIQIRLKYIVQYKDLKQQARYPNTITSDQDIVLTLNEINTNNGGLQRWT